ncbi:MAG: Swt1 family HEPN domain-containing protein [Anaerolineaceae bacterium]|nr:DUF499 domain-containing protein [Brevefilum sp.]
MALSNKERVGRILDQLKAGLLPFILREYQQAYPRSWVDEIDRTLTTVAYQGLSVEARADSMRLIEEIDVQGCLNLMWRQWNELFQEKLGHNGRSYVSELIGARNEWAHGTGFSLDEARRIADTASLLLKAVNAPEEEQKVAEIGRDLLELIIQRDADRSRKEIAQKPLEITTQPGLQPWRQVVRPHPDVSGGNYRQAEFVADLSQVIAGTASHEYQDPVEFFRRTYLTDGLLDLLVTGINRLTCENGEPVIQLKTAFGGGKTHSMLALYHLTSGKISIDKIPGGERIVERVGYVDLPEASIAVLVGTALDVSKPVVKADASINTLWGLMAYQLGGLEGYQMVQEADQKGVSPGSDTLSKLLDKFGPCLIIIDELVAYARNIHGIDGLPSGKFESVMTFMQALTEAVRKSPDSLLCISIPESEIELGGRAGKEATAYLEHTVGRMESIWKPVSARESFEIVRRRLFDETLDYQARDAVINAFADLYRHNAEEFPAGVAERDYIERMTGAYPIHPELFDRLYEDWSTLERFQRTRGVLRLMAAIIHQLWIRGDQSLLIMPGTTPLDTTPVRNEILRYLPDTWSAVFDTDVDGVDSKPFDIDESFPNLGRYSAARRVARAVFIGSAPSSEGAQGKGLEDVRIRFGCAQPGESTGSFGDALRRMAASLTYLYSDGSRYWYDTRPTVNKLARDRAQGYNPAEVAIEIVNRLKAVPKNRSFAGFHVAPATTLDVIDEDQVRIVVLGPGFTHKRGPAETNALAEARRLLESRGNAQRLYKNMLVFIAADDAETTALNEAAREFLAWNSIYDERESLNLDPQQQRQVRLSQARAEETLDLRIKETYSWLLIPEQPDPLGEIVIRPTRISGADNFYDRAAQRLESDGALIRQWSPVIFRMELDKYIWKEENEQTEIKLKTLWDYLARYCYFPRLLDKDVLKATITEGVSALTDTQFAYAARKDEQGYHRGVVFRQLGTVYFDDQGLIVHPKYLNLKPEDPVRGGVSVEDGNDIVIGVIDEEPPATIIKRFYGKVSLDPQRVQRDVDVIIEEVIQKLTSQLGTQVEIVLEVRAEKQEGFEESTIRTINENSRTLNFDTFGFEE